VTSHCPAQADPGPWTQLLRLTETFVAVDTLYCRDDS
jgi:hypothetical protein